MERQLSKDEMDALLRTADTGQRASAHSVAPAGSVMIYDFRCADRVPKGVLQSLQVLHDKFCASSGAALSAHLRIAAEVRIQSIDQMNYGDFVTSLPEPTCFNALGLAPLKGLAVLQLDLGLVFPIIEILTGGSGAAAASEGGNRNITEIEQTIVEEIAGILTANLSEAWRPAAEVRFTLTSAETRPQPLQIAPADEVAIVIGFEVKLGERLGAMQLCIPYSTLKPIRAKFEQDTAVQQQTSRPADCKRMFSNVLKVPLEITVELPPTMVRIRDLRDLSSKDIITLDSKIDDCIRVRVGGRPVFEGHLVQTGRHKTAKLKSRIED